MGHVPDWARASMSKKAQPVVKRYEDGGAVEAGPTVEIVEPASDPIGEIIYEKQGEAKDSAFADLPHLKKVFSPDRPAPLKKFVWRDVNKRQADE